MRKFVDKFTLRRIEDWSARLQFFESLSTTRAQFKLGAIATSLNKEFPDNTFIQNLFLPTIRGAIAIREKDPDRAVRSLEPARAYEIGVEGGLLPAYMRGLAYLDAKDGTKAAAEFQTVIEHPGVVLDAPIGPLARLQIARAFVMQKNLSQAKTAYDQFLDQWKGADPDIPILKAAKNEYSDLRFQ